MSTVEENILSWRPAKHRGFVQPLQIKWRGSIDNFDFEKFRARIKKLEERHGLRISMIYVFSTSLFARFLLG